jgi:ADP-heptose:LPS heptosyltransferase
MLLTETPRIRREERGVLRYYTSLAESLGATVVSYRTQVSPTEEHRRRAREMLAAQGLTGDRPIMAVHPGASGAFNVWPPERFAALSETVRERGLADVVICGAPFDRGAVAAVRTAMTKPVHVLEFTDDVLDLASVFERCRLVVCNDSGPWHLALAVGAATLVFMARFKDQSWHVYRDVERCVVLQGMDRCVACPPDFCRNVIPPGEEFGNTCIRMIGVDRAVDQAMKLLGG